MTRNTFDASEAIRNIRDGCTVDDNGCWIPNLPKTSQGDVRFKVNGGNLSVHRLSHLEWIGPIEPGHYVRQSCKNRACFNPSHLFTAPPREPGAEKRAKREAREALREKMEAPK